MSNQKGQIRQWLMSTPPTVWISLAIISLALWGGFETIKATSDTSGSTAAIATVVAAVVGVVGTHIGHVTGHPLGKQWLRPPGSAWLGFGVILFAMVGFAALLVIPTGRPDWSAEAIATVVAAVVGVAGTHIGHVVGHSLGKGQVMPDTFETRALAEASVVVASDGSAVRPLCRITGAGSFAHFQLEPGEVTKAVSHASVQEIWYIIAGTGELWRRQDGREQTVALRPGVCLTIPLRTAFQFRSDEGDEPLQVVAVTMPPWPIGSGDEARFKDGPWHPAPRR